MIKQKTFSPRPGDIEKKWYVVDANGQTVGRLATKIADCLRGKNKPIFSPHVDVGDYVVVINADKVEFSGNKWDQKVYYRHTNHMGGLKSTGALEMKERYPERIIMNAVRGMLPKTSLGRKQLTKLKVFAGQEHAHEAQNPEVLS